MKLRKDKSWNEDAKTIQGGPRLAKMLRELNKPKEQDVRKIFKSKEVGQ
jgi:hypothetical protein